MFRRGTIHFAVACALVAPSAAAAQEPVQLDPDSPAGVEYQLPLDQARRDAAPDAGGGGPRSDGGSGGPAPLFGAGIAPDGSQDGDAGGGDGTADDRDATADDRKRSVGEQSRGSDDSGAPGAGGGDAAGPGASQSAPSFSATADGGGASNGLTLGGIALAVVVVGGGLGLALRRGLRTATS